MEVARLSAQLAAQTHEVFRLQEAALRAKQVRPPRARSTAWLLRTSNGVRPDRILAMVRD